jgi:ABC-2 type transport system ATP-binding protein
VKHKEFVAIKNISFFVKEGEIFGLLGPNGAGKSTTIKTLTTLIKPFSGTVKINGHDIRKETEKIRESIALLMQEHALDLFLTVYDNLKFYAMLERIPLKEMKAKIEEILNIFGLSEKKYSSLFSLSGGQFRRLQLARIFLSSVNIFFLDEPTMGIDIEGKEKFWNFLKSINRLMGITMVIATNDLREAENLCDRIAFIKEGKIIAIDTPESLKDLLNLKILTIKTSIPLCSESFNNHIIRGYKIKEDNLIELEIFDSYNDLKKVLPQLNIDCEYQVLEYRKPSLENVFLYLSKKK